MNLCVEKNPTTTNQFHIETLVLDHVQDIATEYLSLDPHNYALSHKVKWSINPGYQSCYYGLFNSKHILIGYFQGYYPTKQGSFWIQTFMIRPSYVRQGLGTIFFKMMIKQIQINSPLTEIYLTCYDANEAGQHFWRSLGFNAIKHFSNSSKSTCIHADYSLMKLEL